MNTLALGPVLVMLFLFVVAGAAGLIALRFILRPEPMSRRDYVQLAVFLALLAVAFVVTESGMLATWRYANRHGSWGIPLARP